MKRSSYYPLFIILSIACSKEKVSTPEIEQLRTEVAQAQAEVELAKIELSKAQEELKAAQERLELTKNCPKPVLFDDSELERLKREEDSLTVDIAQTELEIKERRVEVCEEELVIRQAKLLERTEALKAAKRAAQH